MTGMNMDMVAEYMSGVEGNQAPQEKGVYAEFSMKAKKIAESGVNGLPIYEDRIWIDITPAGGNQVVNRWATEKDIARFKQKYDAFIKGVEAPVNGLAVENWPSATPAEVKMLKQANVRTVEDLAMLSETGLKNVGFGARGLQSKAREFLASAAENGQVAVEMVQLKTEVESLKLRNEELERQNEELRAEFRKMKSIPNNQWETEGKPT